MDDQQNERGGSIMRLRRTNATTPPRGEKLPEGIYPVKILGATESPNSKGYQQFFFLVVEVIDGECLGKYGAQAFNTGAPSFVDRLMRAFSMPTRSTMLETLNSLSGKYAFAAVNGSGYISAIEPAELEEGGAF